MITSEGIRIKPTTAARISAANNLCITTSPCKNCKRVDKEKNICCMICDRLKAYQRGDDWTKFGTPGKTPKFILGAKKDRGTCLAKGCERDAECRGFCTKHYNAWKFGRIKHPKFGKFFHAHRGKRGEYRKKVKD